MKIHLTSSISLQDVLKLENYLDKENIVYSKKNKEYFLPTYDESVIKKLESFSFVDKIDKGIININQSLSIGGKEIVVIAGPCAVENRQQLDEIASSIKESGACILRGGAYKPRTSPYSFQGLKEEGLIILEEVGKKYHLPIISEVMSINQLDEFSKNIDIIQVGARNMQNFELLKALGKINKPILLKRGFGNTIDELLSSAEYIIASGNKNVILCERGIRTFENSTRYTLDLSAINMIKLRSTLPVVVDPSHATGDYRLIENMSLAAIAGGADGLLIEVHNHPEDALCDKEQALRLSRFKDLVIKCTKVAKAINREIYEN